MVTYLKITVMKKLKPTQDGQLTGRTKSARTRRSRVVPLGARHSYHLMRYPVGGARIGYQWRSGPA